MKTLNQQRSNALEVTKQTAILIYIKKKDTIYKDRRCWCMTSVSVLWSHTAPPTKAVHSPVAWSERRCCPSHRG